MVPPIYRKKMRLGYSSIEIAGGGCTTHLVRIAMKIFHVALSGEHGAEEKDTGDEMRWE
jgi:hypothetical protein